MKRHQRTAAIIALVLVFAVAGLFKLIEPGSFKELFAGLGLPEYWIPVTGAAELLGAVLIAFFRRLARRLGAALLAVTMVVATVLHLLHDPVALALPAFMLLLLAGYVALVPSADQSTSAPAAV